MVVSALIAALAVGGPNSQAKYVEPIGIGGEKCQSWVQHHSMEYDSLVRAEDEWLAGYLSAFNTFAPRSRHSAGFFRFDLVNVRNATTSACRRQPQKLVFEAVTDFVDTVERAARSAERLKVH